MSTNYNLNHNNRPNRNNSNTASRLLLLGYIMVNGVATGRTIATTADMIKNGYDRDLMIATLIWLLLVVYSGQRAYQTHKRIKNDNDNQKQR